MKNVQRLEIKQGLVMKTMIGYNADGEIVSGGEIADDSYFITNFIKEGNVYSVKIYREGINTIYKACMTNGKSIKLTSYSKWIYQSFSDIIDEVEENKRNFFYNTMCKKFIYKDEGYDGEIYIFSNDNESHVRVTNALILDSPHNNALCFYYNDYPLGINNDKELKKIAELVELYHQERGLLAYRFDALSDDRIFFRSTTIDNGGMSIAEKPSAYLVRHNPLEAIKKPEGKVLQLKKDKND